MGEIAFTGGVGIASEWEGDARDSSEWRHTLFLIKGPAVFGLQGAFMENWIEMGRPLSSSFAKWGCSGYKTSFI